MTNPICVVCLEPGATLALAYCSICKICPTCSAEYVKFDVDFYCVCGDKIPIKPVVNTPTLEYSIDLIFNHRNQLSVELNNITELIKDFSDSIQHANSVMERIELGLLKHASHLPADIRYQRGQTLLAQITLVNKQLLKEYELSLESSLILQQMYERAIIEFDRLISDESISDLALLFKTFEVKLVQRLNVWYETYNDVLTLWNDLFEDNGLELFYDVYFYYEKVPVDINTIGFINQPVNSDTGTGIELQFGVVVSNNRGIISPPTQNIISFKNYKNYGRCQSILNDELESDTFYSENKAISYKYDTPGEIIYNQFSLCEGKIIGYKTYITDIQDQYLMIFETDENDLYHGQCIFKDNNKKSGWYEHGQFVRPFDNN